MATTYTDERGLARVETTGSIAEAAGGIAVVVLSIIGLARADAGSLIAIAVIILGAALLAEGGTIASEFSRLLTVTGMSEFSGGMTGEIMMGGSIIVLGILSLVGVAAAALMPVAVIAAGGLLLISAPGVQRINEARLETAAATEPGVRLIQAAGSGAIGLQVLTGLAAVVLGILALTAGGTATTGRTAMFTLVGLLVLGASALFRAGMTTGNLTRFMAR